MHLILAQTTIGNTFCGFQIDVSRLHRGAMEIANNETDKNRDIIVKSSKLKLKLRRLYFYCN